MAGQFIRGANPYGGDFAAQGAVFIAALHQGFNGGETMGPVAAGAITKFFGPIGESHCINFYTGGMKEGASVPLNGFVNTVFNWMTKYNLQSAIDGAPINDKTFPVSSAKLVNGVYQIAAGGNAGAAGSFKVVKTRTSLV